MRWFLLSLGCGILLYGLSRWQRRRAWNEGPHYVEMLREWHAQAPHIPPVRPGVRAVKTPQVERTARRFYETKGTLTP